MPNPPEALLVDPELRSVTALRRSTVRAILSLIGVTEMALLQFVILAETIQVAPSTVQDVRALAKVLEHFVRAHQVPDESA